MEKFLDGFFAGFSEFLKEYEDKLQKGILGKSSEGIPEIIIEGTTGRIPESSCVRISGEIFG